MDWLLIGARVVTGEGVPVIGRGQLRFGQTGEQLTYALGLAIGVDALHQQ
jgi:hypothetical protein